MITKTSFSIRRLTAPTLVATSLALAFAVPANAVSAQFSFTGSLDAYKQQVLGVIDSTMTKLQQSADSLNVTLNVTGDQNGLTFQGSGPAGTVSGTASQSGATGTATTPHGTATGSADNSGATGTVTGPNASSTLGISTDQIKNLVSNLETRLKDFDFNGSVSVPKDLKLKLQTSNKQAIAQLTKLKTEVNATANVQDLQTKAKQFDQELKQITTANVQASVTKSIDSMTQVLDRMQVAANALQSRVDMLKECVQKGVAAAEAHAAADAKAHADSNGLGASASLKLGDTVPKCSDLNVDQNSGDEGASLQAKLDEIHSTLETIKSFLTNSIGLVAHLKNDNFSGTLTSFQGISSQVDIVANLSANVQNDLLNLSAAVNKS